MQERGISMSGANSRQRRPIGLDDLFAAWPRPGRLEFSPEGQRMVYEYNGGLWITDREGGVENASPMAGRRDGRRPRMSWPSCGAICRRSGPQRRWQSSNAQACPAASRTMAGSPMGSSLQSSARARRYRQKKSRGRRRSSSCISVQSLPAMSSGGSAGRPEKRAGIGGGAAGRQLVPAGRSARWRAGRSDGGGV